MRAASAGRTTLISGPTGAGKEIVASALHKNSSRADKPLIVLNCAALPEQLVDSELFGHCRGAFTGATDARCGLIRSADGGTLFLDEIDSLNPAVQSKLLRFLETHEYRAVGSDVLRTCDAWVIASTNQDVHALANQGRFRADLLYRLEVVRLDVPPLRERPEDILPLAEHFMVQTVGGVKRFTSRAHRALLDYDWPGNVRQLKHRVESACLLADGDVVDADDLGLPNTIEVIGEVMGEVTGNDDCRSGMRRAEESLAQQLWHLQQRHQLSLAETLHTCERALIRRALDEADNNRAKAARLLGIHVRTMFKKLDCRAVS